MGSFPTRTNEEIELATDLIIPLGEGKKISRMYIDTENNLVIVYNE